MYYLGKHIQNEIIESLGGKIKSIILNEVEKCTYYSVIYGLHP